MESWIYILQTPLIKANKMNHSDLIVQHLPRLLELTKCSSPLLADLMQDRILTKFDFDKLVN